MGLTMEEKHDQWMVVSVLLVLYTAFFFAALAVAVVFLDLDYPSICRGHQLVPCCHCQPRPALYAAWAACALLFAPALRCVLALLPPLTPAAATLAFTRAGCSLGAVFLGLLGCLAVAAAENGGGRGRYVVACASAATVSFAGLLVFCACLVRERREGEAADELGSVYRLVGASDEIV